METERVLGLYLSMEKQAAVGSGAGSAEGIRRSTTEGYLTVAQVARLLGVAPSFVYRRTSAGHADPIPCYRFGGHLRFLRDEVEDWASEHRKEPTPIPVPALVAARRRRSTLSSVQPRRR